MRVLIDVDGVVADLMGGFEKFVWNRHCRELRAREITTFKLANSPAHQELHAAIDLTRELEAFLALPDCYGEVEVIEGAQEGIGRLQQETHMELAFVTATMKESPESYAPKFRWLAMHFPGIPVISCPSDQKHWFDADFGVDDRYDTCQRFESAGITPLLFRQPWNEAPEGNPRYDWKGVVDAVLHR